MEFLIAVIGPKWLPEGTTFMTNVLIKGSAYMKITVNAITGTIDVKHQQGQIMSSSLLHPRRRRQMSIKGKVTHQVE